MKVKRKHLVYMSVFLSIICAISLRPGSADESSTAGRASKEVASVVENKTQVVLISTPPVAVAPANPCDDYWNLLQGKSLSIQRQDWFNHLDAPGYFRYHVACDPGKHWDGVQFDCANSVIILESHWNHNADNPISSALGIGQLMYGNRKIYLSYDPNTRDPRAQARATADYMQDRYGTPCNTLRIKRSTGIY